MTRILFWNINNFSLSRISGTGTLTAPQSQDCGTHMLFEVFGQNVPDIFVVIEVYGRTSDVGMEGTALYPSADAGMACVLFLNNIRAFFGNAWCLVPPINSGAMGFREGVAVFYNSAKVQFTGPYIYCNVGTATSPLGQSLPITATNYAAIMDYDSLWKGGLPAARTVAVNIGGTSVSIPEARMAGQWQYFTAGTPPAPIYFPSAGNRAPFLTRFVEVAGGRVLNLFSVHTSPSTAVQAINQMTNIPELQSAPAGSTNIVLGDFNVDTYSDKASCYNWYVNTTGYDLLLTPQASDGNVYAARKPYLMTHLLPNADATPCAPAMGQVPSPILNVYPRYGYMGAAYMGLNDKGALDNCMVLYGTGTAPPATHNVSVVNTIVGKPYTAPVPPITGVDAEVTGGLAYLAKLAVPIPPGGAAATTTTAFQAWQNFGRVRTASDHLAVLVDV